MKILGLKAFKKLCREIYQNSTKGTSTNLSETTKKKNCSKHEEVQITPQVQKARMEED